MLVGDVSYEAPLAAPTVPLSLPTGHELAVDNPKYKLPPFHCYSAPTELSLLDRY